MTGREALTGRSRARRGSITRERVVSGGLALIDEEGFEKLTMPRLAERLGVGTMSLYRHVHNKAELVEAIAELAFAELDVPDADAGDWRGPVVGYLLQWRSLVHAHPGLVSIIADRALAVPAVYDQLEEVLAAMRRAGFDEQGAVRCFYTLFTYVLGFVVWELPRSRGGYEEQWRSALGELSSRRYRMLHGAGATLASTATDEQFRFGLDLLVSAMEPAA